MPTKLYGLYNFSLLYSWKCQVRICHSSFKNRFDNLFRKYITYTGGEELFGLPVCQYPQLLEIKKQLTLLQKLYGLYNTVIDTVNGYNDILWADINIENINNELLDFQTRYIYCDINLIRVQHCLHWNISPLLPLWSVFLFSFFLYRHMGDMRHSIASC